MENDDAIKVTIRTGTSTRPSQPRQRQERPTTGEYKDLIYSFYIPMDIPPIFPESVLSELLQYGDNSIYSSLYDNSLERNPSVKLNLQSHSCQLEIGQECCICQTKFSKDENLSTLECNHTFHIQCIVEWGKYKQECPICRKSIPVLEK